MPTSFESTTKLVFRWTLAITVVSMIIMTGVVGIKAYQVYLPQNRTLEVAAMKTHKSKARVSKWLDKRVHVAEKRLQYWSQKLESKTRNKSQ